MEPEKKIRAARCSSQKPTCAKSRCPALRMGAQSLHHAKDYLGEFFRRITRKLGRPQAITATAHKLARIVFHLLSTKEAYNESVFHKTEEETIRRAQYRLCRQAAQLGFQIIPVEPNLAPTGCGRRFHQIHAALSRVPKSSDRPTRPTRNQEFGGRLREDRMPTAESGFDECLGCA